MTKHYAVTIKASRTEIDPRTYAERLGKLLDRSPEELEEAIRGDTVVLERGLSYAEAIEIQRELSRRKIPSQVSSGEELSGRELFLRGESFGREVGEVESEMADVEMGVDDVEMEMEWEEDHDHHTAPKDGEAEPGAWAELFPDLVEEPPSSDDEEEEEEDWSSESFVSGPVVMVEPEGEGRPELFEDEEDEFDGEVSAAGSVEEEAESEVLTPAPVAPRAGPSRKDSGTARREQSSQSGRFDADKIHAAFSGTDDGRPPYKPKGYDKRPEHVPLFAALLSVFAPGAGQVFNGQPEEAQHYSWTFFMIWPWVKSVRQAMKYGEKVRTYYAPRPEPGAAKRALLYCVKWWLAIGLIVFVSAGLVSMVQDHREQQAELRHQRAMSYAVDAGVVYVMDGVHSATQAADEVEIEEEEDEEDTRFTMADEERAQRVFVIGYKYCQGGNYAMCERLMDRVRTLEPANHDAFRLRTWAGLQKAAPDPERPMPEVEGEVPTLEELELQLAIRGKDLDDVDADFSTWWEVEGEQRVEERERLQQEANDAEGEEEVRRQVEEALEAEILD